MWKLFIIGFSSPSIPSPQAPPPVPESTASEEKKAAALQVEKEIERRRVGRSSTILTGGLGLTEPARVDRKTLLGQ